MHEPELHHGFGDSRRLTGPNRWFAGTAVTLAPLGVCAADGAAHARWCQRVQALSEQLQWGDAQPHVVRHAGGVFFVCAAPTATLFTATEVAEWAWEQELAAAGDHSFDIAQPFTPEQALATFSARAAAEQHLALQALLAAAEQHDLPFLVDDEDFSVGAGSGSRTWPLSALPSPHEVPWPALHNVPTALVTGSNGKTTTTRLIAAMAQAASRSVGLCSTEGVVVNGQLQHSGDYSGPAGARAVLRDARVQVAVLETARGGILRRGLAVQRADVAVVTNISADHFGEYGVDSADDLAEVKLVVARAVTDHGVLVLNADDTPLMRMAERMPHAAQARQALFAAEHTHPALVAHRAQGGSTCGAHEGQLLLCDHGQTHSLGEVAALPVNLFGAAPYNTANAMAAALAAVALGLPVQAVRDTLAHFGGRPSDNPGRLERWQHRGATVLIDYAHNPDGLTQLLTVARALKPQRLWLLLGQAGNRGDAAISELARVAAAFAPDRVVIKELPAMLRGRALGEVPTLLERALVEAGLPPATVQHIADEEAAAFALLAACAPGLVLVLPLHTAAVRQAVAAHLMR